MDTQTREESTEGSFGHRNGEEGREHGGLPSGPLTLDGWKGGFHLYKHVYLDVATKLPLVPVLVNEEVIEETIDESHI